MTEQQLPQTSQPSTTPSAIEVPSLPFTMKANLSEYRKRIGPIRITLALVVSLLFLRFGVLAWILSVIGVALLIVAILMFLANRTLTVTNEGIEYKGPFGRVKKYTFADISTVKLFFQYIEPTFGLSPRLIIGKKGGGSITTMTSLYWNVEDMDKLGAVLQDKKVTIEAYDGMVVAQDITKEFPDYVSYAERHPYIIAFGVTIAIIVVVTLGVLAFS